MERRDFIRILLGTAIAEAVDVEKLLWTPRSIITVPSRVPSMSESEIVKVAMDMYFTDAVRLFERDNTFYKFLWDKHEING